MKLIVLAGFFIFLFMNHSVASHTNEWKSVRALYEQGLTQDPTNVELIKGAQIYSLSQAYKVLSFYENEIRTKGPDQALAFANYQGEKFNYLRSVIETVVNSYNVIRLITSHYFGDDFTDKILMRWVDVLEQIHLAKLDINLMIEHLKESDLPLEEKFSLNLKSKILNSSLIQEVTHDYLIGRKTQKIIPLLEDFGITDFHDFIDPQWEHLLKEQISILNALMLIRGPAMVKALAKTKTGQRIIDKLKLRKVVEKAAKLKKPWNSILLWLSLETADGCLIRYAYIAYTVGDELTADEKLEIERYLDSLETVI